MCQFYACDMCGSSVALEKTRNFLNRRYCTNCIGEARSQRMKKLKETRLIRLKAKERKEAHLSRLASDPSYRKECRQNEKRKKEAREEAKRAKLEDSERLKNRLKEYEEASVESLIVEIRSTGLQPIVLKKSPVRLKRNEVVYFLAGDNTDSFRISFAITNQRIFLCQNSKVLEQYTDEGNDLAITPGIKAIPLASVLAIDIPVEHSDFFTSVWKTRFHLNNGKDEQVQFAKCRDARMFYVILAETVDRINDPIDDSAFSPNRERIPDEVKVAVWRRDKGVCVRCGSRINLEYDHIIPISKGGANTIRNIELLCEQCNRHKSDRVM